MPRYTPTPLGAVGKRGCLQFLWRYFGVGSMVRAGPGQNSSQVLWWWAVMLGVMAGAWGMRGWCGGA